MILYIFYNADILDIPNITTKEDAMGYVDDINFRVIAKNFQETTKIIRDMMTRQDDGHQWSITHNSLFGVPKSAITHYSRRTIKDPHFRQPANTPPQTSINIRWPNSPRNQAIQIPRDNNKCSTKMERTSTMSDSQCNKVDPSILMAVKTINR